MNRTRGSSTLTDQERQPGICGPPPADDRVEIRWARMSGREVVIKAARHPHRSRLRREAEVLRRTAEDRAAAGSVVEFVELTEGPDHTELVTSRHGTVTLADVGLLGLAERTEALVSLCEMVERFHAAGWAHGSIEATHVLVDTAPGTDVRGTGSADTGSGGTGPGRNSVRLCSTGDAEQLRGSASATARSADCLALGALVLETLEAPGGFASGRQRRRYRAGARRARKRLGVARGLHDGAAIANILRETVARRTAAGNGRTTNGSAGISPDRSAGHRSPLSGNPVKRPRRGSPRRSTRWSLRLVGTAAIACLLVGAAAAWTLRRHADPAVACMVDLPGGSHACGEVTVEDNVVGVADQRFALGGADDIVAVGDWDCDGTGTALLLELSSGRLFHFDAWSTRTEEVAGDQIGAFEGATGLRSSSPCEYPDVELADGSVITPLERSPTVQEETG